MEEGRHPETEPEPSVPPRTKKPEMAFYVPKRRQGENQPQSKEKPQSASDKKPKARPRYTDKARRYNSKGKKDKNTGDKKETQDDGCTNGEGEPNTKDGDEEKDETREEKAVGSKEDAGKGVACEDVNAPVHTTSELQSAGTEQNLKNNEEEEEKDDNWDSLFTDDGECLNPHLLQEV